MKIIIDNSNLFAGGGIQVATSFLKDLNALQLNHKYHVVQSPTSSKQIDKSVFSDNFVFYDLPNRSVPQRIRSLKSYEKSIQPDVIFTTFGPSYYRSRCPNIVGFAIPHLIYNKSPFFSRLSLGDRIKFMLINCYKKYFFYQNSDALIFETEEAREVFMSGTKKEIKSFTVGNTLNEIFLNDKCWVDFSMDADSDLKILCLSANYPHKNLGVIPGIIDELINRYNQKNFKFVISLEKEDLGFDDCYEPYINYIGHVNINQIPSLYQKIDFLLMPTLLEVFSTTFLEAMFMEKPIVASDMGFVREVCDDSALYSSPLDAAAYAKNIYSLMRSTELRETLINKGKKRLKVFGDSLKRTKSYLHIIENFSA